MASAIPASSLLAQMVRQTMAPVVMVLTTPLVEEACNKNNLGFVDLLRPFCVMDQINVPVRTASETPYRLQEFQIRMFYASEIRQLHNEIAEERLLEVVANASAVAEAELQGDPEKLEVVLKMVESENPSSWFQVYSREFMRTLAFSEHEAMDHPVTCLVVVSTKDADPVNKITEICNANLPAFLNDSSMDSNISRHYLLLHDNQDGPADSADDIMQHICGTFGAYDCSLLSINSGESLATEDLWTRHRATHKVDDLVFGSCLQTSDLEELQDFVVGLCQKQIIPYMEQKIRFLNQQVAATRKGLRNQIKNLWWRKGKDDIPETPTYTFSSMESQIRVLADYAFMLQDYELAVSNYRLLATDYKTDKAWKRYAGAMEMVGLSLGMLDQSRKEADYSMDTAYVTYQKCSVPSSKYAARTALWWAEIHKTRAQYRDAAAVLFRAATEMDKESTLRSGVFLEQSAYCYLRSMPPMIRKYGFNLVLAGNRYNVSAQRKHAVRVYRSVLSVYEGQGWNFISDHVHFHLGRLYVLLGKLDAAVHHFVNLIACKHQSPANQTLFLKEFLNCVQNVDPKQENVKVGLPVISSEHAYVRFEDQRTYASSAAASLSNEIWSRLEEGLVPSTALPVTTWLDAPKTAQIKDFNLAIAGEEISLFFEVSNPLQISIDISSMSLVCEFEPLENDKESEPLNLSEESFSLRPGEKSEFCLKVKAMEEGILKIVGVKWVLCGVALGSYDFIIQNKTKKNKRGRDVLEIAPKQRLKFHIVGHMPRVDISLHELPFKVNAGELKRLVLEITNPSHQPIHNIKLKTSHPEFLLAGDQKDLDLEFPHCLEVCDSADSNSNINNNSDSDSNSNSNSNDAHRIFSFPKGMTLEGKSTMLWPLWLHSRESGEFCVNTVVYYEPAETSTSLRFRTLRMTHSIQVVPSLNMSVKVTPCPVEVDSYVVRLDVRNEHPSHSLWLRQVSCGGVVDVDDDVDGGDGDGDGDGEWCFAPLSPQLREGDEGAYLSASLTPSQLLPSTHSSSFFFQLMKKKNTKGDKNVRLGKEPLLHIYSPPLSYFHQQERLLQRKEKKKKKQKGLDIIVLSERQDESFHLASHHVCHCSVADDENGVVWALEGVRCVAHDFQAESTCEVALTLVMRNRGSGRVRLKVESVESTEVVWCGEKSTVLTEIASGGATELGASFQVFAAATYELSNYVKVTWSTVKEERNDEDEKIKRKRNFISAPATLSSSGDVSGGGGGGGDGGGEGGEGGGEGGDGKGEGGDGDEKENVGVGQPFLLTILS